MYINGYKLDEYQYASITDGSESILVIAGAGAGKSLTILGKIKYLLDKGIKEDEILVISFTNETVKSLKEKINNTIDIYTFHKLGLTILDDNNITISKESLLPYIIDEYIKSSLKNSKELRIYFKRYFYKVLYSDNLFKTKEYINLKNIIIKYIKLIKSNDYDFYYIYKQYKKSIWMNKFILRLIMNIYVLYEQELRSTNSIDFDDMLIKAKDKVKEKNLKYKYIIIDEFQDTSLVRLNLIKEIIKYTNAKLFAVGDDYQSIYRFNGCDINIFLNFNKYFNNAKIYKLKYTYRNSQQLIDISVNFIMRNKYQIKKEIISDKRINNPVIVLYNINLKDIIKYFDNYLILGRNNSDIDNINDENKLTIHKSKGLEADNIFLINSDSIPNLTINESIMDNLFSKEHIIFEEERRLFYVALTRAKKRIFIFVNKKTSPFVKELISNYNILVINNLNNFLLLFQNNFEGDYKLDKHLEQKNL